VEGVHGMKQHSREPALGMHGIAVKDEFLNKKYFKATWMNYRANAYAALDISALGESERCPLGLVTLQRLHSSR